MATIQCSICNRRFDSEATPALPFCSEQCRRIDLGRWFDERYSLPHEADEEPPDEGPPADQ